MSETFSYVRWEIAAFVLSLCSIIALLFFTNPIDQVYFSLIFFTSLFVFIWMAFYLLVGSNSVVKNSRRNRAAALLSLFITLGLMLKSTGSLSVISLIAIAVICSGIFFYAGRRT